MGTIVEIECINCGYKKELFIGGGLNDWDIKNTLSEFSGENFSKLYQEIILSKKNLDIFSFSRYIGVCNSCKELCVVPIISFKMNNKKEQEVVGRCPKCNDRVNTYKNNTEILNIKCPKCGSRTSVLETGNWD